METTSGGLERNLSTPDAAGWQRQRQPGSDNQPSPPCASPGRLATQAGATTASCQQSRTGRGTAGPEVQAGGTARDSLPLALWRAEHRAAYRCLRARDLRQTRRHALVAISPVDQLAPQCARERLISCLPAHTNTTSGTRSRPPCVPAPTLEVRTGSEWSESPMRPRAWHSWDWNAPSSQRSELQRAHRGSRPVVRDR